MKTFVIVAVAVTSRALPVHAQQPAPQRADSLRLGALHAEAERLDPRQRQIALQASASDLRLRNIAAARRPTIVANGQAQYQSAVPTVEVSVPGVTLPAPSKDTYDAHVDAQKSMVDLDHRAANRRSSARSLPSRRPRFAPPCSAGGRR